MNRLKRTRLSTQVLIVLLTVPGQATLSWQTQEPSPQQPVEKKDRGLGLRPDTPPETKTDQTTTTGTRPEIVLQAGISVPQTMIAFSPDGRLLASMGMMGNSVKVWEVSTGRLLRQLESSIPNLGASTVTRPFRFSRDGKSIIALADGRARRWEVETGRELSSTLLTSGKDSFSALLNDDGRILAATDLTNSSVRVWDTTAGRQTLLINLQDDEALTGQDAVALSSDGRLLALLIRTTKASRKGLEIKEEAAIWDLANGKKTKTIKLVSRTSATAQVSPVDGSLSFTPDGTGLAIRDENSIRLYDLSAGSEVKAFAAPKLYSMRTDGLGLFAARFLFSPDRRVLSVLGEGNNVVLLDTSSGAKLHTLPGHEGGVVSISFSSDGNLLASSGIDNQIKLWNVATGKEVKVFSGAAIPVEDLAISADGKTLTLAGPEAVTSWELMSGGVRRAINIETGVAPGINAFKDRNVFLSQDGRFLMLQAGSESIVKVLEVATGKELHAFQLGQDKDLGNAAFARNAPVIALSEQAKKKSQNPAAAPDPLMDMPASMPDMSKVMEQMRKDPKKAQEQMQKVQEAMSKGDLSAGLSMMESLGIMPVRKSSTPANTMRFFELGSGQQLQAIALPTGFLDAMTDNAFTSRSTLSFSPDGSMLASAVGFNQPLILREATTGREVRTLKSPFSLSVSSLAWSRDSKKLASSEWGLNRDLMNPNAPQDFSFEDMKFTIKVWDPLTGKELNSLAGHGNFVGSLSFSPDGRQLASGSQDSTIKIWDLGSGREVGTLKAHSGAVTALEFTADGQFLISASDDGSVRLWQAKSGALQATIVSLNKGLDWLVITPDGLFDGSPAGWKQILWRFTPNLYDVSPVEIFFNEYFRPGLLPEILAGRKPSAATDISKRDRRQPLVSLALSEPTNPGSEIAQRTVKVKLSITDAPAGAQDLRLFRNGSLVKVWRGDVLSGQTTATLESTISLVAGENYLTAYAFNRDNVKSSDATLLLKGSEALKRPSTLHLLVVGINQYANSDYNLRYAVADANAFAEEVRRQQQKLGRFQRIEITSLLDQQATKANLLYALKRLGGEPATIPAGAPAAVEGLKRVEPEDAVIVFYAGHGTAQSQRFYLIPHDIGYQGPRIELDQKGLNTMLAHSISDLELEQAFALLDASLVLMVIDACNSGQALEAEEKRRGPMNSKGLAQLAWEKGMYILTAAQSYQAALEAEQLGHGYLTFALVEEGLKSAVADNQPRDSQVLLREWLDYATERVPLMQEEKMRASRGMGVGLAFVEGEQKEPDIDKRNVQRPRVFYRREPESQPLIVAKP